MSDKFLKCISILYCQLCLHLFGGVGTSNNIWIDTFWLCIALRFHSHRTCRKGIRLIFLNSATDIDRSIGIYRLYYLYTPRTIRCGNANELGYAYRRPGKSCLFFIRVWLHGIGSAGDMEMVPKKHRGSCGVQCVPMSPWKSEGENDFRADSYPISAAGLQGEQPLVD